MAETRKTAVSWADRGEISVRGYSVTDLMGAVGFGDAVFLILQGRLPSDAESRLFNAVLTSVIDHGVKPPSTIAAMTVANTGSSLNAAVAAGILAINKYHGGAIEDAMTAISKTADVANDSDFGTAAAEIAEDYREAGIRVSGFGHRLHSADPRTVRLFELADEVGMKGKFVASALALELALEAAAGRALPINADGAIAAILCELDFSPAAANGLFMIARVPGLVARVVEEQERNPPMRTIDANAYEYDGPTERKI